MQGIADWAKIRAVKEAVSVPVVANGNILFYGDIARCLEATGADAVMSAEGNLYNPAIFVPSSSSPSAVPAIWALNAQVVRAAQYGCNCRGVGSPGGCGELDILETLPPPADAARGVSEVYSFKGATGSGNDNFFARPTGGRVTYAAVFDEQTDSVAIQRLQGWDYAAKDVGRSVVDGYLNAPALVVDFATGARRRSVWGGRRRAH